MDYNEHSRKRNALLVSASGMIQQVVQILGNFVYRTVFLMFLSKEYLGIQGLFSNVLQLFSLAELGIGSAILYSMYKPFAQRDADKIGALVSFYKRIYNLLAILVLVLGACFYPFIWKIVDVSDIPSDVNLTLVYALFVIQSAVSYLFVYKQSLLMADQRNHLVSLFTGGLLIASFIVKTAVLAFTRKYEWVLLADILVNLLLNGVFSIWITRRYSGVFKAKMPLPQADKQKILKDTGGLLLHKIGNVVVTSTDNIVLTKFVSLAATGIYSNYATIVTAITNIASKIFPSLTPIVANFVLNKTEEESYTLMKRLLFLNLWMASFTTVCLYLLLNPFIEIWLDRSFLLSQGVVAVLCLQHYMQVSRMTSDVFINGCGLFMKDRIRPLIESFLNIVISVGLAKRIGIAGVFIGTCISGGCTYFWRQPYLIFKHYFHRSQIGYWLPQVGWLLLTVLMCYGGQQVMAHMGTGLLAFVWKILVAAILPNVLILLLTLPTKECKYYLGLLRQVVQKRET